MISEAICARRATIGVFPIAHDFKPDERQYRDFMVSNNWCRFLALADLTPEAFLQAVSDVTPLTENHLDVLADKIAARLPGLFA